MEVYYYESMALCSGPLSFFLREMSSGIEGLELNNSAL